jgi:hypothetical protein
MWLWKLYWLEYVIILRIILPTLVFQRSATLVKDLKEYNIKLRDIQKNKKQEAVGSAAMGSSSSGTVTDEPSLTAALLSSRIKLLNPDESNNEKSGLSLERDGVGLLAGLAEHETASTASANKIIVSDTSSIADPSTPGSSIAGNSAAEEMQQTQLSRALRALEIMVPDPGTKTQGSRL